MPAPAPKPIAMPHIVAAAAILSQALLSILLKANVRQVLGNEPDRIEKHTPAVGALHLGDIGLQAVSHGIEARPGGDVPRLHPDE